MKSFAAAQTLIAALALAAPLLARAAPPANVQQDVQHLLAFVEKSNCSFYRNGSWSDAREARQLLREKYDYLVGRGKIASTQDFIEQAATESSVTRLPYQFRCAGSIPVLSGPWLREELARYQAGR